MIEKIDINQFAGMDINSKCSILYTFVNELIDTVNELQKNYDNVCVWVGEQKLKKTAENVPEPIKLYVCPDGFVYDNEDVAKSHAKSIFNPLPELDRTRKALDVALCSLQQITTKYETEIAKLFESQKWWTCAISMCDCADKALEQITALEQKDVK